MCIRDSTNSDHCFLDMLLYTDLCSIGLDFMKSNYKQYDIKTLPVNGCEKCLLVGYVTDKSIELEEYEKEYIESLGTLFQ